MFLQVLFPRPDLLLSAPHVEWHAGAAVEVTFMRGVGWWVEVEGWVGVVCVRLEPGQGAGWRREEGGAQEIRKCLCHLESPALVRNVRPLRAQIMYWMRPLYF